MPHSTSQPLVSVIVPAYNAAPTIARAIDSVFGQRIDGRDRIEIIVCDDGSTDDTGRILAGYGDRLRVIRQENRGRGAARNACVAAATGEWLAMLDADDWWLPTRLASGLSAAEDRPDCDVFCANAYVVDGGGTVYRTLNGEWHIGHSGDVFPYLLRNNFVPFPTVLVRRSAVDAIGGFDETLPRTQDLDFLLRLAAHHRFFYDHTPQVWVDNRNWGTTTKRFETYECFLRVLDKIGRLYPDLVRQHDLFYRRSYCDCHAEVAGAWEEQGDYGRAAEAYAKALSYGPTVRGLEWKRCLALYRAGAWDEARSAITAFLRGDEFHSEARFYLGNLFLRARQLPDAMRQYEQALYSAPLYQKFPECLNNLAVTAAQSGDSGRALGLLEHALEQQRFFSDAIKNQLAIRAGEAATQLLWTQRKVFR